MNVEEVVKCDIWVFHSCEDSSRCLLGCDAE